MAPLRRISCKADGWLAVACEAVRTLGVVVVEDAIPAPTLEATGPALRRAWEGVVREIGMERLRRSGELGIARLPMKFDPIFFRYLEIPELLSLLDAILSPTAILHLQNGFLLPHADEPPGGFQHSFHRDFPRHLNGYMASLNVLVAVDEFTERNGATLVLPGTHQRADPPAPDYLRRNATPAEAKAGSLLVFDSTLWHAAGPNRSGAERLAINHQFTVSYLKQQVDYVRALGNETVLAQPPRTQQLLGWYTRVVTSLDEYYRLPEERLYRARQG